LARKILLADDSVTAQNMGRKILADAGYDVVTVNNGSAALKRITEIKPDLIVLDVYMPGYSGLEVCQRVKDSEETAHIPVLLTVGKLEPFKPEEARRVRAEGHIVKPFEASELLTAISRLEDHMVPQRSESARFGTEGSAKRSDNGPGADNGWKSRLGFPSKKKKDEPEDAAAGGSFRDFRKAKGKTGADDALTVKVAPAVDPGTDIPRDITPGELDALSALAAKLDEAGASDGTSSDETSVSPGQPQAVEVAAEKSEAQVFAVEAEAAKLAATNPDAAKEEMAEVETPAVASLAVAPDVPAIVEIPVEHLEAAAEGTAVEALSQETQPPDTRVAEGAVAVDAVAVNAAVLAQDPAPVDRSDEPTFASATYAVEQAAETKTEPTPFERVAVTTPEKMAVSTPADAVAVAATELESASDESAPEEPALDELKTQNTPAEGLAANTPAQPVEVAHLTEVAAAEGPAPSDEELAQALRLLTPANGQADFATIPSNGSPVDGGSRWVAEPVKLSQEESAFSLEAEMFRAFAAMPVETPVSEETSRTTGVSVIATAVENRLAAVGLAASETALPQSSGSPTGQNQAPATDPDEALAAAVGAGTFPDAGGRDEVAAAASKNAESIHGTTAMETPSAEASGDQQSRDQDSSSQIEDEEAMRKNVKSREQVRSATSEAAGSSDAVAAEETPKAMAAAAAEVPSAASTSAPAASDANSIASIVDSVMNDLRPKIVEEIAKRLAGK
jgi:CheY-like chemotaxis protein